MTRPHRAKLIVALAVALFALALWPAVAFANRIEPFVFGLPFYLFWMVMLDVAVAVLLTIALYVLD